MGRFLVAALVLAVLLFGCSQQQGQQLVCNKPYIQVGNDCCLDKNDDKICDRDEKNASEAAKPAAPGNLTDMTPSGNATAPPDAGNETQPQPPSEKPEAGANESGKETKENAGSAGALNMADDFTPCKGYQLAGENIPTPGPWGLRLLTAYSEDGLNWVRQNRVLYDQADVPDAIIDDDGNIRVYFVPWCPQEVKEKTVVAISRDGVSWVYKKLNISGVDMSKPVGDPDIVRLEDGRWRLYFTVPRQEGGKEYPSTVSAISSDGINFVQEQGYRFSASGADVMDPTLLKIGGTWHYFAGKSLGVNWRATSKDGLEFTEQGDFGKEQIMLDNGIAVEGGYRFYGFVNLDIKNPDAPTYIKSLFSKDGENWELEAGKRLELDTANGLEYGFIKGAPVVRLGNGTYLMIYTVEMPEYASQANTGGSGGQQPEGTQTPGSPPSGGTQPPGTSGAGGVYCDGICDSVERSQGESNLCYKSDC